MSIDYSSKDAIRQAAVDVRKKHGALDWDAKVDDIIERQGLSQGRFGPGGSGLGGKLAKLFSGVVKKVKALVSIKESVILVANDLPQAKEPFAKAHEVGHSALPWHRAVLYVCDEHDLSASTRAQMEWEANTFAAELLLPEPLLARVYTTYPTSMETVLLLRQWTGASIEACATAYVQSHPGKCLLLSLKEESDDKGNPYLRLERKVVSRPAVNTRLSGLANKQTFATNHVLYVHSRGRSGPSSTVLTVGDDLNKKYRVSLMNNTYKVLAIVHDDGR
jgi:Zn-dependent peptidase ImmA (M78 family)